MPVSCVLTFPSAIAVIAHLVDPCGCQHVDVLAGVSVHPSPCEKLYDLRLSKVPSEVSYKLLLAAVHRSSTM